MGSPRRHHAYTERGTDRNGERHCVEDHGWRSASGGVHGEVTASNSRFRRLVFEKFEEEMQSQLSELTAQEFLDCGYGNEMEKYSHVVHRKAHRERSPTKNVVKPAPTLVPTNNVAGWDWNVARKYGTNRRGVYGYTTF